MKRLISLGLFALIVAGCASDIMNGYVGKSLAEPIMDYGPPQNAFDLGDGRRAFIWNMQHSFTTPGYSSTTGSFSATGNSVNYGRYSSFNSNGIFNAGTHYQPPTTTVFDCNYVLYAKPNGHSGSGPASWTVVGFRPPSLGCE